MLSTHISARLDRLLAPLRALLPWSCVACGGPGMDGRDLCQPCSQRLPPLRHGCPRCAQPLLRPAPLCGRCLQRLPKFDTAYAPLRYRAPVDALVQRFKLGGKLAVGRVLAELLADALQARAQPLPELIVPVPLHPERLRQRGFDQAIELGRVLSRRLALPLAAHGLQRLRDTPSQSGLRRRERRGNVHRAFAIGQLPPGTRSIALLDDVLTTGATANACARVLRRAGVERVEVWAVARAGRAR